MTDFPETRESLLLQVKDPANRMAWEEFARIYRPIIYRIARTRAMQEADAQDLAQQVLISVAAAIGRYEKHNDTTRFRNWLSRITRNAIVKALSRGPKELATGGSAVMRFLEECPEPDGVTSELIELEYRRELYRRAAAIVSANVQAETWRVFELTVIEGLSIEEAAGKFRRSPGSIYALRSRVMRKLIEAVRDLEKCDQ